MDIKYDEVSSGFIIYRKNADRIEYLILESSKNKANWTPPKGFYKNICFQKILNYYYP